MALHVRPDAPEWTNTKRGLLYFCDWLPPVGLWAQPYSCSLREIILGNGLGGGPRPYPRPARALTLLCAATQDHRDPAFLALSTDPIKVGGPVPGWPRADAFVGPGVENR